MDAEQLAARVVDVVQRSAVTRDEVAGADHAQRHDAAPVRQHPGRLRGAIVRRGEVTRVPVDHRVAVGEPEEHRGRGLLVIADVPGGGEGDPRDRGVGRRLVAQPEDPRGVGLGQRRPPRGRRRQLDEQQHRRDPHPPRPHSTAAQADLQRAQPEHREREHAELREHDGAEHRPDLAVARHVRGEELARLPARERDAGRERQQDRADHQRQEHRDMTTTTRVHQHDRTHRGDRAQRSRVEGAIGRARRDGGRRQRDEARPRHAPQLARSASAAVLALLGAAQAERLERRALRQDDRGRSRRRDRERQDCRQHRGAAQVLAAQQPCAAGRKQQRGREGELAAGRDARSRRDAELDRAAPRCTSGARVEEIARRLDHPHQRPHADERQDPELLVDERQQHRDRAADRRELRPGAQPHQPPSDEPTIGDQRAEHRERGAARERHAEDMRGPGQHREQRHRLRERKGTLRRVEDRRVPPRSARPPRRGGVESRVGPAHRPREGERHRVAGLGACDDGAGQRAAGWTQRDDGDREIREQRGGAPARPAAALRHAAHDSKARRARGRGGRCEK